MGNKNKSTTKNNNVTGGKDRQFKLGKNGTKVSDWQVDPRNPNFESKIVERKDGTSILMGRQVGQNDERPHVSQEYDTNNNTNIKTNIHEKNDNF